jgi:hypothetical protein
MPVNQLWIRRGVHILVIGLFMMMFHVVSKSALQEDRTFTINVNDPRPLASAIQELEKRYEWVITYEDPPYIYTGDIEDVTMTVRKDFDLTKRALVPRGGTFNFQYVVPATAGAPDEPAVLSRLLEAYHLSGYPGVFRVTRTGGVFHVVPSESRNRLGQFEPRVSLLNANISITGGERTALDMLQAVTDAVSRLGVARVLLGTVPLNLLTQIRVQGSASNESARAVLLRTLEATSRKVSWRLLCSPGPSPECGLNSHFVGNR